MSSSPVPPLYVITEAARFGRSKVVDAIERAAGGGLSRVLVREPELSAKEIESFADEILSTADVEIVIGVRPGDGGDARAEVVARRRWRGVHVGGGGPSYCERVRSLVGTDRLVGYSAHSTDDALAAQARGANYVSLSPVFAPRSHPTALEPLGIEGLREACSRIEVPIYALGGISGENLAAVRSAGAAGVAVITEVIDAADPAEAARKLSSIR